MAAGQRADRRKTESDDRTANRWISLWDFNPKRVFASCKSYDGRIGQGWIAARSACVDEDATQPVAGFVHRGAGFIDNADPEHETVIDAVVTREVRRDTGCPQPLGV